MQFYKSGDLSEVCLQNDLCLFVHMHSWLMVCLENKDVLKTETYLCIFDEQMSMYSVLGVTSD